MKGNLTRGLGIAGGLLALAISLPAQSFSTIDVKGVTVTYWHTGTGPTEKGLQSLVDEFNKSNPYGITVKEEYAGNYNDIYNKTLTGIAAHQVPDLVVAYQNQAAAYRLPKGIVDINPYVNDSQVGLSPASIKDFIPGIYESDINPQFHNERLGFPHQRSMEVLYYNLTWLKKLGAAEPPKTWDEFAALCRKATNVQKGTYGYAIDTDASRVFSQTISRGGGFLSADRQDFDLDNPAIVDSMRLMKQLLDEGAARKVAEAYGDQADFGNQKVLFTIGSSSGLGYYQQAVEHGANGKFRWSLAPLPHSTENPVQDLYGASVSITKTTPQRQLASWLFLKWFTQAAQQKRWVEISGYFPTRRSVRDSLGPYLVRNPVYAKALDILLSSDVVTEPPFSSYQAVRAEITKTYNAILDGADIKSALAKLTRKANQINADARDN